MHSFLTKLCVAELTTIHSFVHYSRFSRFHARNSNFQCIITIFQDHFLVFIILSRDVFTQFHDSFIFMLKFSWYIHFSTKHSEIFMHLSDFQVKFSWYIHIFHASHHISRDISSKRAYLSWFSCIYQISRIILSFVHYSQLQLSCIISWFHTLLWFKYSSCFNLSFTRFILEFSASITIFQLAFTFSWFTLTRIIITIFSFVHYKPIPESYTFIFMHF